MAEAKPIPNQKLRHERERRAWSQLDVADKVGTTPLNVGRWERGITMPGPYFRQKLCEIFEKSAQELGLVHENTGTETPIEAPLHVPSTAPTQEVPPLVWNVPYNRNPLFTGREEILTQVHLALISEDQPLALTQPQAISGLGGIGKTQTAVEYAYRYRDHYEAVFWARADTPELLSSDYLLLAALLTLPQRNEQDQSLVVKAVLNWFDTHGGWLLILDNADDLEMVNAFIPSAGKGHVLLTTRAHSTGTTAGRIELETMGLEEGIFLLLRRAKLLKGNASSLQAVSESVRNSAQAIVEAVGGLPLALDQAGAYIEGTGCSLSDYLKFYKTHRNRLLRKRGESAVGHPEPVATTWSLSFEKVERANPAAAELLRLCAFLHPDEIPEAMLVEGASELGPILQPVAEDEMELNEAIGELRKYSLVKRDPEKKILNIHRLVQAVIKDGMDKDRQREWAERVVKMVNRAFPEVKSPLVNLALWSLCQQYLPHVQVSAELIAKWDMNFLEGSQLLRKAGNYLRERGQYREAEMLLQKSLSICERILEPIHLDLAIVLNDLAGLYWAKGEFALAEPLFQRSLAIREQILGPIDLAVARNLGNLGSLYMGKGNYKLAESFALRACTIFEQVLGSDHLDLTPALNNLAAIYGEQGKYEQAKTLFQRVLSIREQALGPDHPNVALSLYNLAHVYQDLSEYEMVESLYQRALIIWEHVLGINHPDVAKSLQGLAQLYYIQGKYEQAEQRLQRALAIREQHIAPYHPEIAQTLNDLASLHRELGKYEQAEEFYQRALVIREQVLGKEHLKVAITLENYALLLRKIHREDEAAILEARAQAIRAKQE